MFEMTEAEYWQLRRVLQQLRSEEKRISYGSILAVNKLLDIMESVLKKVAERNYR